MPFTTSFASSRHGPLGTFETRVFRGRRRSGAAVYSDGDVMMGPEWSNSARSTKPLKSIGMKRHLLGDRFSSTDRSNDALIEAAVGGRGFAGDGRTRMARLTAHRGGHGRRECIVLCAGASAVRARRARWSGLRRWRMSWLVRPDHAGRGRGGCRRGDAFGPVAVAMAGLVLDRLGPGNSSGSIMASRASSPTGARTAISCEESHGGSHRLREGRAVESIEAPWWA